MRPLLWAAIVFSIFVNLLMLTSPLYMLQIYDRVLSSRSEATLIALTGLMVFLFLAMGLLDYARGRLLGRIGARLQARLDRRVFTAAMSRASQYPGDPLAASAQRDLEAVQRYWASPIATAMIDLPWTPIFLIAIFIFHPMLGWFSLCGGLVLAALALTHQLRSKGPILRAQLSAVASEQLAERLKSDSEILRALGMSQAAFQRWSVARNTALVQAIEAGDLGSVFGTATRTLRLFLQSAILGLGAWLVLRGEMSSGAMIAGSIVMGRALAPIEQAIGHWGVLTRAREGKSNLEYLLCAQPAELARTALPRPKAALEVEGLSVLLPGNPVPVLRNISFRLAPGQALGIIGPSGAGKSTLGRALIGAVRPVGGKIRLDGAELSHYDTDVLGRYIGYLPQNISLFDTSIAENIARLAIIPDANGVIAAAKAAAAHDMIQRLPQSYDTKISSNGAALSGGQVQRIGLARALYGNPVLLILDEPNSNLDNIGSVALNQAIRRMKAEGHSVIVIAHRPAALQECDMLLMLEEGQRIAFGLRDDVLREMVKNHTEIVQSKSLGGLS